MISFPFNSNITGYDSENLPIFDRAIDSITQRKFTKALYKNGVKFGDSFKVKANSAMTIIVEPGVCVIEGVIGIEESRRTLQVQSSSSQDRIDRVVLRLNEQSRSVDLYIKKGTPSNSPIAPYLTKQSLGTGDIYELGIADIFVSRNSVSITSDRITDTRLNSSLCGVITSATLNVDTSSYSTQMDALIETTRQAYQNAINQTTAGRLENTINTVQTSINSIRSTSNQNSNSISTLQTNLNQRKPIKITSRTLSSGSWSSINKQSWDTNFEYKYRQFVSISNMTSNDVFINGTLIVENDDGNIGVLESTTSGFYAYAKERINKTATIRQVVYLKG